MNSWLFGSRNSVFLHFIKLECLNQEQSGNILGKYGEICSMEIWESTISKKTEHALTHFFNFWNFEVLIFWQLEMMKSWNHEKSKTRNLLTSILQSEFLQKLGFISIKKTWNENVVNRTNFSIFGQGNPYHQSTYRFPPLHPILPYSDFSFRVSYLQWLKPDSLV